MKTIFLLLGICVLMSSCSQNNSATVTLDFEKEKSAIQSVIAKE